MLRLLGYLLKNGIVTERVIPDLLDAGLFGLPDVTSKPCQTGCDECIEACPTAAITQDDQSITIDRGACIGCAQCINLCPSGTIKKDLSTATHAYARNELMRSANRDENERSERKGIFRRSLAIRVVSTGCSACDLEVLAVNNPIFDIERFGINVVASPRFADALLITGPVPKAMHAPLLSCYEAMARPKIVIACGTCSISGGVHEGTYTEANGVTSLLPVDVFIPGCPPHPWQLVNGILAAQRLSLQGRTSL